MRTSRLLLVLPLLALGMASPPQTVDGPRLFGIQSVIVGKRSIEVTKDATLPAGLDLRKQGERLAKATVKVGESFEVTDGHHIGHTFKLLAIKDGRATVEAVHWMALLGAKPTRSESTIEVWSYVTRRERK